jgi:hypothetical protein
MKRAIIVLLTVIALTACDNRNLPLDQREYSKTTLTNIPELAGCVYIKIEDIRIFRCPNSSTSANYTVKEGRADKTVTTTVQTNGK